MVDVSLFDMAEKSDKKEPSIYDAVIELFNVSKGHIDFKTELTPQQVNALTKLEFMSKYFKLGDTLGNICNKFKRLKISEKRQGRTELVNSLKNELVAEQMKYSEELRRGIVGGNNSIIKSR
jgi:hypothetical protein